MQDISNMSHESLLPPFEHDDLSAGTPSPNTPPGQSSCTLRRTVSHASLETIVPSNRKGIRRSIAEIAETMKQKAAKKNRPPSAQNIFIKLVSSSLASDSSATASQTRKLSRHGRRSIASLRDSKRDRVEKENNSFGPDRKNTLIDEPLQTEDDDDDGWDFIDNGNRGIQFAVAGSHVRTQTVMLADAKDVKLDIKPFESDVTIWDGLDANHHMFRCKFFLRCTAHPYDAVALPDVRRIEMDCNTFPVQGSRYVRDPVLQCSYADAMTHRIECSATPLADAADSALSNIELDKYWRTIQEDDSTWGWYKDAQVPLSSRLFDKADHREFKLAGRVWIGEDCIEDELRFGISMLLREVDMK